jgi:hypothetical protein
MRSNTRSGQPHKENALWLAGRGQERHQGKVPGLHQGSVDRHAAAESEKKDAGAEVALKLYRAILWDSSNLNSACDCVRAVVLVLRLRCAECCPGARVLASALHATGSVIGISI